MSIAPPAPSAQRNATVPEFTQEPMRSFAQAVDAAIGRLHRSGLPVDLDDARQEAWLAVLESAQRFSPAHGRAFSYAHTTAKRAAFNYATWTRSPLKLSKQLIESGGDLVAERWNRRVELDSKPDPDRFVPAGDPGPEINAMESENDRLRAALLKHGREMALKRCAGTLPPKQRKAVRLVLWGENPADASRLAGVTNTALGAALRAFTENVRSDVYCAGLASQMASIELS